MVRPVIGRTPDYTARAAEAASFVETKKRLGDMQAATREIFNRLMA